MEVTTTLPFTISMRGICRNSIKRESNRSTLFIQMNNSLLRLTIINLHFTIRSTQSRELIKLLPDFKKVVRINWLSRRSQRGAVWVQLRVWRLLRNNSSRRFASLMQVSSRKMEGLWLKVFLTFQSRLEQHLVMRVHKFPLRLLTFSQWSKDHLFTILRIKPVPKDIFHSQSRRRKPHRQSVTENQHQKFQSTMNQNIKMMMEPI